jgi:hypothetical protein
MSEELQYRLVAYVAEKRFREFVPTLTSVELVEYVTEDEFHLDERIVTPDKFVQHSQIPFYVPENERKAWLAQVIADIGISSYFYLHGYDYHWAYLRIKDYQQMIDEFSQPHILNHLLILNAERSKAMWLIEWHVSYDAQYRNL